MFGSAEIRLSEIDIEMSNNEIAVSLQRILTIGTQNKNFKRHGRMHKLSQPNIVGYFSVDRNRQFVPDFSNCKYLKLPSKDDQKIHLDLNKGYEVVERKSESANEENLDHILKFILLNLEKLLATSETSETQMFLKFDVICFRGKLRMLMCTPYEFRDGWSLLVTKFKGNIYICGIETDEDRNKRQSQSEESKRICSYGFKFEQYIMADSPTSLPDIDVPVRESEEFCCMFTSKLDATRILFGAEMDGIESEAAVDFNKVNLNDLKFTEVKVRIKPSHQRQIQNFNRFKTRQWWCQSYLTNVQKIIVGLRTEKGIVDEIETINVETLPRLYKEHWSSAVCMEFLNNFLQMVKHKLRNIDCPHTVYKFDYDPKQNTSIQYTIHNGCNKLSFLPSWYTDQVLQKASKQRLL